MLFVYLYLKNLKRQGLATLKNILFWITVQLLVGVVSSYRHDKEVVDSIVANSEAELLHDAIKAKQLNRSGVIWILSTRNFYQLRATFACYKQKYGNPIDQVQPLNNKWFVKLLFFSVFHLPKFSYSTSYFTGHCENCWSWFRISLQNGYTVHWHSWKTLCQGEMFFFSL